MKKYFFISVLALSFFNVQAQVTNETEFGVILSRGNTSSESYQAKEALGYKWLEINTLKFTGNYLETKTNDVQIARNWLLGLRYDRDISSRLGVFLGEIVESDKYAGYNQKYNTDLGLKYALIKEDKFQWNSELGYRYTIENQITGLENKLHYVRAYTEALKEWNENVSTKLWFEYLPNLTIASDYQMNTEASITAALTRIFSLKTAYLLKYDHLPNPGARTTTDNLLTSSFVAKF